MTHSRSALSLLSLALSLGALGQNVAYIYGDVSADGAIPSGAAAPFHQMLLSDNGNRGCSQFKAMVEDEGYSISQHYDRSTTLDIGFLEQFEVIVFGLHQKIWSSGEKAALDDWIRGGGGILMYSDSAAGGLYSSVGINNATGQRAVNNVLSPYGMEVTVDQGGGTRAYTSIEDEDHPLAQGSLEFEGEGVSPVAVDESSGARVLYPLEPAYQISGGSLSIDTRNVTIDNPRWAALALQEVGEGNVIAIFDRQPVWNNGEGSDIERRDNEEVLRRIVKFLAGDLSAPDPVAFNQLVATIELNPDDGRDYLQLSYLQASGGTGTLGVDYRAGSSIFRIELSQNLATGQWTSGPQFFEPVAQPIDQGDGTEWVSLRVHPPIDGQPRAFARLGVFDTGSNPPVVDAGPEAFLQHGGIATLAGTITGDGVTSSQWSILDGPGTVSFTDSSQPETTATFGAPGIYQLLLTAPTPSGTLSDSLTVFVADPTKVEYAINAGGPDYSGSNGFEYLQDDFFSGGHIDSFPGNPVSGTAEDTLYNTARSGHSSYDFPVQNGIYRVYLQFAETYFTETGKRTFDVSLEGQPFIDDLDLHASAPGKWAAHDLSFLVTVDDGILNLDFSASVNNPLVNAIVIVRE